MGAFYACISLNCTYATSEILPLGERICPKCGKSLVLEDAEYDEDDLTSDDVADSSEDR